MRDVRKSRRRVRLIARAPRSFHRERRTARIRRRQEGEGPQAPPCGGYGREPADGSDSCGEHSGSGRRAGRVGRGGRVYARHCRRCSRMAATRARNLRRPCATAAWIWISSSFPSPREARVLRFSMPPLGGGTDSCLAEPLPTIGQRTSSEPSRAPRRGFSGLRCGSWSAASGDA